MKQTHSLPLFSLVLLASIASFGAIIPTPALPAMAHFFHSSASNTELIISVYLFGYAIGQLLYGPLANYYGRKRALYIGMGIALIGNLFAMFTIEFNSISLLIFSRLLTAIGAASGIVITMIMIKDSYRDDKARQMFANIVLAFSVVPFLATALGGMLTLHWGWESTLVVTLLYSLLSLGIIKSLPETLSRQHNQAISVANLVAIYSQLLTHWTYIRLVLIYGLAASANYAFSALAPMVVIQHLHITAEVYGWLSIIPALGMFIGGGLSSRLATRLSAQTLIFSGVSLIVLSSLMLTILFYYEIETVVSIYLLASILMCGVTLISPNASMQAIAEVQDHANATALMNTAVLALASLVVSIASHFMDNSILTFAFTLLIIGIFLVCIQFPWKFMSHPAT